MGERERKCVSGKAGKKMTLEMMGGGVGCWEQGSAPARGSCDNRRCLFRHGLSLFVSERVCAKLKVCVRRNKSKKKVVLEVDSPLFLIIIV